MYAVLMMQSYCSGLGRRAIWRRRDSLDDVLQGVGMENTGSVFHVQVPCLDVAWQDVENVAWTMLLAWMLLRGIVARPMTHIEVQNMVMDKTLSTKATPQAYSRSAVDWVEMESYAWEGGWSHTTCLTSGGFS
ncbi:hypothetical protein Dimus_013381 [Dionaea muscipula]